MLKGELPEPEGITPLPVADASEADGKQGKLVSHVLRDALKDHVVMTHFFARWLCQMRHEDPLVDYIVNSKVIDWSDIRGVSLAWPIFSWQHIKIGKQSCPKQYEHTLLLVPKVAWLELHRMLSGVIARDRDKRLMYIWRPYRISAKIPDLDHPAGDLISVPLVVYGVGGNTRSVAFDWDEKAYRCVAVSKPADKDALRIARAVFSDQEGEILP